MSVYYRYCTIALIGFATLGLHGRLDLCHAERPRLTQPNLKQFPTYAYAWANIDPVRDEKEWEATVSGKYRNLLKKIHVPQDSGAYGQFNDYGPWTGTSYAGHDNLPRGHWVYVFPHWYIWGETTEK